MGSSTAAGYFPDGTSRDSSWAYKLKSYYKAAGIIDTIYNIAASGRDCYTGMPTGYIPPAGRYNPDPLFNITKAVSFVPKPDIIIINFPTNNYEWMSNEEILFCLRTMRDTANAHNIRCFITTTQPRDYNQAFQREKLRTLKTLIENEFGVYSIDFWTSITLDPPIVIKPEYAFGDGVHLNPAGHTVLENIVIQKNIFFSPVAITFGGFSTSQQNGKVKLTWYSEPLSVNDYFCVQRAADNNEFQTISYVNGNLQNRYAAEDAFPEEGNNFYRVKIIKSGVETYSTVSKEFIVRNLEGGFNYSFINDVVIISIPANGDISFSSVISSSGQILSTKNYSTINAASDIRINLNNYSKGVYFIKIGTRKKEFQTIKILKN